MSTMSVKQPISGEEIADLQQEATDILGRLQAALRSLIKATPGLTNRAADLQRTLGVHSSLAWQVHKVAHAADPLAEAARVPGPMAMKRFLEAARRRGTPIERITAVNAAQREYEELISAHADSRAEFDSMIGGLAEERPDQIDLQQKRAAFTAASHLLGVHADTQLSCYIFGPCASDPMLLDAVNIRGLIDLRRSRQDASWIISTTGAYNDDGDVGDLPSLVPLVTSEDAAGVGLMPQFCSSPLPTLREVTAPNGMVNTVVEPNGIGAKSAVTCLVGHHFPSSFPRYRDETDELLGSHTKVRTPCKVLIHDMLVLREMLDGATPRFGVYSDHRMVDPSVVGRECDLLPLRERIAYLGSGLGILETPDVPRYVELAEYAFDRVGWKAKDFDIWRVRIEYPVMPSSVVMQFDLAEKQGR